MCGNVGKHSPGRAECLGSPDAQHDQQDDGAESQHDTERPATIKSKNDVVGTLHGLWTLGAPEDRSPRELYIDKMAPV